MIQIIPAIDVIEGKCVRLTKGDYETKKLYAEDPLEMAKRFEDAGLNRLHLVDLDGAKEGRVINYRVLERIAGKTKLTIDFGGGIGSEKDLEIALECGARMINVGSIAVKDPTVFSGWLKKYGGEVIILAADVKEEKVVVRGWQEESKIYLFDLVGKFLDEKGKFVVCTDVSRDGTLEGPSLDLYKKAKDEAPEISLIASGGVSSMQDIEKLQECGLYGVIVGKAIYEGRIALSELKAFSC